MKDIKSNPRALALDLLLKTQKAEQFGRYAQGLQTEEIKVAKDGSLSNMPAYIAKKNPRTIKEARKIAEENGFANSHKKDSQDICFVPNGDYVSVIKKITGKSIRVLT